MQLPHTETDNQIPLANTIPTLRQLYRAECHIFSHRNNHILFDIDGGSFFAIDDITRDLITLCEGQTLKALLDTLQDRYTEKQVISAFKALYGAGIVTDLPPEKPRAFVPPNRLEVVRLNLEITNDTLPDTEPQKPVSYMTWQTAQKSVDLLLKESGRIKTCRISFRDGEPLLNPQLVEKTIAYGLEQANAIGKEMTFEIVTDGRLLNEELVNRFADQPVNIVVKLDTDDRPPLFHSSGPYSLSSVGVPERFEEQETPIHLQRIAHSTDIMATIKQGLAQYPTAQRLNLRIDEVQNPENTLETLAEYVANHVLSNQSVWLGEFEDRVAQVFNQDAFFYHSGEGVRSLNVSTDGTLYALRDNVPVFDMGHVDTGIDRDKQKTWMQTTHVENMPGCKTCWARHLCGGSCQIASPENTEDLTRCEQTRRTYELAMATCLEISSLDSDTLYRRYAS